MWRVVLLLAACGGSSDDAPAGDDAAPMPDTPVIGAVACEPLAMPAGRIVDVTPAQAGELGAIALAAQPGDVIQLADGTYPVTADVVMNLATPNVTLISASRDATKVIIDGGAHEAREILQISASNITIAHVTIQNARNHMIHLYPGGGEDLHGIVLYGLVLVDGGQQFIKSNTDKSNAEFATAHFVDDVTLACSTLTMTAAGRAYVPTNPDNASYPCYTGGIDAHGARNWLVRRNRFEGIYCDVPSLAEHAIHFWQTGRDQVIEQNVIVNCARGIGLGLGSGGLVERPYSDAPYAADKLDPYAGNYGGIIRNNFIYADVSAFDSGISLEQALGVKLHHDTVVVTGAAAGNAIEYRFPNAMVDVQNCIATTVVQRENGRATLGTIQLQPATSQFVDAAAGDLHLAPGASGAIDLGTALADVPVDIDGDPRSATPDLGADELP